METYCTQVMELLSLERVPGDRFQIKIGVTHQDRQASYIIEVDELTYSSLSALDPLNGDRVRLSPYPKWDPYRHTYYCSLVRTTNVLRETMYFACSEVFAGQLQRLQQSPSSFIDKQEAAPGRKQENVTARIQQSRESRIPAFRMGMALRHLMIIGLLVFLCFRFDYSWLSDGANVLTKHWGVVKAAETETVETYIEDLPRLIELASIKSAEVEQGPLIQTAAEQLDYEVIGIDAERVIYGLPKGYVALTFDDGPSVYTKKIVDILVDKKVAATFLFVGQNVERNRDAAAYANERGMAIGNHSWDHSRMTKASHSEQAANLARASQAVESVTHTPVTLFRPPYGLLDEDLIYSAQSEQLKVLMWNRDPKDWHADNKEDILRYFREVNASGGIYVLHEDPKTVEALPEIIEFLQESNLKFVTFK
jgi:peptidoglycan-N-acetylglucosamine deacetylase